MKTRLEGHQDRDSATRARGSASVVLLCASLAVLGLPHAVVAAEPPPENTIVIATGSWTPYVEVKQEEVSLDPGALEARIKSVEGPLIEVVRKAFSAVGVQVDFVSHPWTRNAQLVQSGAVDAALPYYCSVDRAQSFICSDPVAEGEQVFFHRREMDFDWSGISDLRPYTIGATLGYFYGETFEVREAVGDLKVLRVAKDEVNLKLLTHGRIDLFPQDRAVGYAMIRDLLPPEQWADITHHPKPLHRKSLHLIYTRATDRGMRFSRLFDRELAKMKESGELAELLQPLQQLENISD